MDNDRLRNNEKNAISLDKNPLFLEGYELFHKLSQETGIGLEKLFLVAAHHQKELIPISAFDNKELSCLETVCVYLKEEEGLGFTEIGKKIGRSHKTIWATYAKAKGKRKEKLSIRESKLHIPLTAFSNRKLSPLESLAYYLHTSNGLRFSKIGKLLHRSPQNVWAAYTKAQRKLHG